MRGIEDLVVWREAASLAANVLEAAEGMKGLGARAAARQLIGAAESIASNISEGYGRGVNQDCIHFFIIARASSQEVENHLRQATLSRRLPAPVTEPLIDQVRRARYLINRFIQSVEGRMRERGND